MHRRVRAFVVTAAVGVLGLACSSGPKPSETSERSAAAPAARVRRSSPIGRPGASSAPGEAQLDRARAAAKAGQLDQVVTAARAAIAEDPRLEQAYLLLGSTCALQGNDPCEAAAYRDGLAAIPTSVPLQREMGFYLLRQGNVDEGIRRLESAREATRTPSPSLLADLAVAYKMKGDLQKARATAETAIEADGTCVECYLARGEVAFAERDFGAAERAFEAAVQKAPDNVEARRSRAKAVYLGGDVERAADLYLALAERAPDDVRVQVQAGQVALEAKRAEAAVRRFEAAATLLPNEAQLLELLAQAQDAASDPEAAQATRARAAALTAPP